MSYVKRQSFLIDSYRVEVVAVDGHCIVDRAQGGYGAVSARVLRCKCCEDITDDDHQRDECTPASHKELCGWLSATGAVDQAFMVGSKTAKVI